VDVRLEPRATVELGEPGRTHALGADRVDDAGLGGVDEIDALTACRAHGGVEDGEPAPLAGLELAMDEPGLPLPLPARRDDVEGEPIAPQREDDPLSLPEPQVLRRGFRVLIDGHRPATTPNAVHDLTSGGSFATSTVSA
jgi:hypothetical protein